VFTLLCDFSKPTEEEAEQKSTKIENKSENEIKGRTLALELLLSILSSTGPTFRSSEKFISLVKKELCLPLSKNGISSDGTYRPLPQLLCFSFLFIFLFSSLLFSSLLFSSLLFSSLLFFLILCLFFPNDQKLYSSCHFLYLFACSTTSKLH